MHCPRRNGYDSPGSPDPYTLTICGTLPDMSVTTEATKTLYFRDIARPVTQTLASRGKRNLFE